MAETNPGLTSFPKFILRLFEDRNLTRKAYLNAVASGLEYAARLLVGFLITPLLVASLGDYFYGLWQMLNRMAGYLSPASGRPTQALKFTLANQAASIDFEQKRRHVGSTLVVWTWFLPVIACLGAILAWFTPLWVKASSEAVPQVRIAMGVLVLNLSLTSLAAVPRSVMEGENLGYKRMGLTALLVIVGGGLTWLSLELKTGLIGVAAALTLTTILTGLFYLIIVKSYVPWYGVARPPAPEALQFLKLSGWFLGWNLIMMLMTGSDVVILGFFQSVESVTVYTLTKYAPEMVVSLVAIVVFGIAPGLGGIIGAGEIERASRLRGEIMSLTWLFVTTTGTTILMWNHRFLQLWVGQDYYVGSLASALILLVVLQFVLIRNDANIIDLTLRLDRKVILGAVSVGVSLAAAGVMVGVFKMGVIGLCLGILLGRTMLTFGYPKYVGVILGESLSAQIRSALRPLLLTVLLFGFGSLWEEWTFSTGRLSGMGWLPLAGSILVTFLVLLAACFFIGLPARQRRRVLNRFRFLVGGGKNASA